MKVHTKFGGNKHTTRYATSRMVIWWVHEIYYKDGRVFAFNVSIEGIGTFFYIFMLSDQDELKCVNSPIDMSSIDKEVAYINRHKEDKELINHTVKKHVEVIQWQHWLSRVMAS